MATDVSWRPILVFALAGCGSGVGAVPTAPTTTDEATAADRPVSPRPAPAAPGILAYVLHGSVYVADMDGSNAVKIVKGREDDDGGTDGFSRAEGLMWSPDGRYLAYRRSDCSVKKPGIGTTGGTS